LKAELQALRDQLVAAKGERAFFHAAQVQLHTDTLSAVQAKHDGLAAKVASQETLEAALRADLSRSQAETAALKQVRVYCCH
jgi:hypothetical protein